MRPADKKEIEQIISETKWFDTLDKDTKNIYLIIQEEKKKIQEEIEVKIKELKELEKKLNDISILCFYA